MADAAASGAVARKGVEVQVLFFAQQKTLWNPMISKGFSLGPAPPDALQARGAGLQ